MAETGGHTAFFYGTLMAPKVLYRVIYGSSNPSEEKKAPLIVTSALLHNYCRHKVRYCDYPGIVPEENKSVRGSYVTGLVQSDIWRLDAFEGSQYDRCSVDVEVIEGPEKGKKVKAETYIFTAGVSQLEDEEWDIEEFMKEKMHRWTDDSEEYAEVDASVEEEHDPTGGRGVKGDMDARLTEVKAEQDEKEVLDSAV